MSKQGRMIGAWGDYCIFQTPEGLFVRFETREYGMRGGRLTCKRTYATLNEVPVQTREQANDIIGQALDRKIELAIGRPEPVQ